MTATLNPTQFVVGQVVRLVGGGPSMTVHNVEKSGLVKCRWFVDRTLYEHLFQPDVLEPQMH